MFDARQTVYSLRDMDCVYNAIVALVLAIHGWQKEHRRKGAVVERCCHSVKLEVMATQLCSTQFDRLKPC